VEMKSLMKPLFLALCALSVPLALNAQSDSLSLRKEMAESARGYENSKRSTAPHRLMQQSFCDEQVGRYCLIYDRGIMETLPGEPEQVTKARNRVIVAFQKAVTAWPSDSTLVAPLIRYLVEADRGAEAVEISQHFKAVTTDKVWAMFLLGFAQHGARDDAAADETFARALHDALPNERQEMHDVTFILSRDEREKYQALPGPQRARYLERLWRLADPLYLTPGNESLVEHLSRKVYTHILALAPYGDEQLLSRADTTSDSQTHPVRRGLPAGLTAREAEVLALIAEGIGNQAIAERLVVSLRTVEHHIANIYRKIGARGRADAVAYALRNGLG